MQILKFFFKQLKKQTFLKKSIKLKLENKLIKDKEKEGYKKLSKEEKNKKKSISKYIEFPYLEELNEKQYNELNNGNWVVCDPGMRTIMHMKNKEGITYRYTNRMHMNKTKRLKYQRLIKNYKDKKRNNKNRK